MENLTVQLLYSFYNANGLSVVKKGRNHAIEDLQEEQVTPWDEVRRSHFKAAIAQEIESGADWRTLKSSSIILDGSTEIWNPYKGRYQYARPEQNPHVAELWRVGKSLFTSPI